MSNKPTVKRKKVLFYKLYLTNGKEYDMDQSDFQKLNREMDGSNNLIKLKMVIVPPNCIVAIEPIWRFSDELIGRVDEESGKYRMEGYKPILSLPDRFATPDDEPVPVGKLLEAPRKYLPS